MFKKHGFIIKYKLIVYLWRRNCYIRYLINLIVNCIDFCLTVDYLDNSTKKSEFLLGLVPSGRFHHDNELYHL